jgi:hypothetical protein
MGADAEGSKTEAVERVAVFAEAIVGRLPVIVVVKTDITEAATAATCAAEVAAVLVVGAGRFAASVVVAVVDGKATSAFPDKSIQN